MIKRFCDICDREMSGIAVIPDSIRFATFAISENGKYWDVCDECRKELNEWVRNRKEKNNGNDSR